MKCNHCGARIHKNYDICKNCGKELYESQFTHEANGLDMGIKNISDQEIQNVAEERKNHKVPITYGEFKLKYYRQNPLPKVIGIEIKGKMLERYVREEKINKLYQEYVYRFDGQD